jgi:DNA-binding CsgD family transcriptional regulator
MSSVVPKPGARSGLRVAIFSSDAFRKSTLLAVVLGAGHWVCESAQEADVVIEDGALLHPAHPAVVRLSELADAEVAGALPVQARPEQIVAAIQAVAVGLSVRVRDVMGVTGFGGPAEPKAYSLLTPREIEVLIALAEGLTNKVIAYRLGISRHTVKFHLESLFRKLGVRSRSQAVLKGLTLISRSRVDL